MRRARKLFASLAVVSVAAALHVVPAQAAPPTRTPTVPSYVAIGDSYSAGPGIPVTTFAMGCYRSDDNFASQLSQRLRIISTRDVSCSGARPNHTVEMQHGVVPAQFDALRKHTKLVTLRIGINQGGLYGGLVAGCPAVRHLDPTGSPCRDLVSRSGTDAFHQLADQAGAAVQEVIEGVKERAPRATVVVVGYPRLAPEQGTCAALPLADGDYSYVNGVIKRLNNNLKAAAKAANVHYVNMWTASRGHDICSSEPWVQGSVSHPGRAVAYHPFRAEHRAVAARVATLLTKSPQARRGVQK